MRVMGRSRREKRKGGRGRVSCWVSSKDTSRCRCRVLLGLMVGVGTGGYGRLGVGL